MNNTIPLMNEADQKKWADIAYLEDDKFIYFRAGRLNGGSGVHSLKKLNDAIQQANGFRGHPGLDATKDEIQTYNIWTDVCNFLQFLKHNLPVHDDTERKNYRASLSDTL